MHKIIEKEGFSSRFELPNFAFSRCTREFRGAVATLAGVLVPPAEWALVCDNYLPSAADGEFIASLMEPVTEAGAYAGWIAPPRLGIDNKPGDFEYVQLAA